MKINVDKTKFTLAEKDYVQNELSERKWLADPSIIIDTARTIVEAIEGANVCTVTIISAGRLTLTKDHGWKTVVRIENLIVMVEGSHKSRDMKAIYELSYNVDECYMAEYIGANWTRYATTENDWNNIL